MKRFLKFLFWMLFGTLFGMLGYLTQNIPLLVFIFGILYGEMAANLYRWIIEWEE